MTKVQHMQQAVRDTDLSYNQIARNAGVTRPWLKSVMEGRFLEPNPDWVKAVTDYIIKYEAIKAR